MMTMRDEGRLSLTAPTIRFWGVRGSFACAHAQALTYGGNTACMEITPAGEALETTIIVDAGSGIVPLGNSRPWLAGQRVDLLLTHLHHDHIAGLPFFKAMFTKGVDLHVWCGNLDGQSAEMALERMFSPPLFPLHLRELPARITHHGFRAGETIEIAGHKIRTHLLRHPSGCTGYRFDGSSGSLAIITDVEHESGEPCPDLVAFNRGVGVMIYDMMFDEATYTRCRGWGHSTSEAAVALGSAAGVRTIIGFHHSPWDDDIVMAERERKLAELWPDSAMAREGMVLNGLRSVGMRVAELAPAAD
jgi:phosphoribosyl 1,2-cyclic phosphodiesterase